jgi:hypothetical protein
LAQAGGDALTEAAERNTPRRTGELAEKWRTLPVKVTPEGAQSGTENPDYRARFIEYGVDAHDLRPRRAEALETPEGPRGGAHHPGHEGTHPLARAAAEVEAELPAVAQPALSKWAAEIERAAKNHPGIT